MDEVQVVHGVAYEAFGLRAHAEAVTLFEAHGSEHACGVFHEAEGVEHAHTLVLDVFLPVEAVHELAEHGGVQAHGHGVDGEVAAVEVHLDGTALHLRKRTGRGVEFEASGGHVHLYLFGLSQMHMAAALHLRPHALGGEDHHGRHEFAVFTHAALEAYGKAVGKGNGVAFHHEVDVDVRPLHALHFHHKVAHEAAHHIGRHAHLFGKLAGKAQEFHAGSREPLVHHGNEVALLAVLAAAHRRDMRGPLAHEEADDVRTRDHPTTRRFASSA